MSNYTPQFIDTETWQIINATIRKYPRMYVELVDGEDDILNGQGFKETNVMAGYISDPTAQKGIKLASLQRREANRKCEAVNWCLSKLRPEHRRVVCLRFWGVESTEVAFELVRDNQPLRGMRYESIRTPETVGTVAGYSIRGAKKITNRFIMAVGKELGEI